MKNIALLLVTVPMLLISCTKDPLADFTASSTEVGIGEIVYFNNRSIDAESFEWDFGDGHTSNSFNASNYYDMDGVKTVRLKAFYKNRVDEAFLTINVIGASLEITVEEYDPPYYVVEDVSVILYPSITDWENYTNKVEEKFTNAAGVVRFDHLAPQRYYVDVWGPKHGNQALAEKDVTWIESPILVPGTTQLFTAVVYYYPNGKKSAIGRPDEKEKRSIGPAGSDPVIKEGRK
jgi:PKD repeat protein